MNALCVVRKQKAVRYYDECDADAVLRLLLCPRKRLFCVLPSETSRRCAVIFWEKEDSSGGLLKRSSPRGKTTSPTRLF